MVYISDPKNVSANIFKNIFKNCLDANRNTIPSVSSNFCFNKISEINGKKITFYFVINPPTNDVNICHGMVIVGDQLTEPCISNKFNLSIPKTITLKEFEEFLVKENTSCPGHTNMEVLNRIDHIANYVFVGIGKRIHIRDDDLKYIRDLILVDQQKISRIFQDIRSYPLEIIHKSLFHDYDAELFSPLLSTSVIDDVSEKITQLYDVAKGLNYMKVASSSMNKYKDVITKQLNDINKLQDQIIELNKSISEKDEKLKLQEVALSEKSEIIQKTEEKNSSLREKNERLRKKAYDEENKSAKLDEDFRNLSKKYDTVCKNMTDVQNNPTKLQTAISETTCNSCLENIEKISGLESRVSELESTLGCDTLNY